MQYHLPKQVSNRIVEYNSVTQANDGHLHFVVVGVEGEYVDLSQTYIYVKAKITTAKGDDITPENIVLSSRSFSSKSIDYKFS